MDAPRGTPWWVIAIRGLFYAIMAASATILFAGLLLSDPAAKARTNAALEEIENHRIASRCVNNQIISGINELLIAQALPTIAPLDLTGLDCEPVQDPLPN